MAWGWGGGEHHIWHKHKQLFPPGKHYAQVSWRQFRCNGASKLIFPQIIWSQPMLAAFLNSLLPATHRSLLTWDFTAFLGNRWNTGGACFSEGCTFVIYYCEVLRSPRNRLEEIIQRPVLKVSAQCYTAALEKWSVLRNRFCYPDQIYEELSARSVRYR